MSELQRKDASIIIDAIKSKVRRFFENHTLSNLNEHLVQDEKLCTYAQIKSLIKFETYLDVINDFKKRQCFSKLRMSAHNLEIEAGRLVKIEYQDLVDTVNTVCLLEHKFLVMKFTLS